MAIKTHRHIWALLITALLGTGLATVAAPVVAAPVSATPAAPTPVEIAVGGSHTCARMQDGSLYCWGDGSSGQLGYGNMDRIGDDETVGAAGPVDLGGGRTAVSVEAGETSTCAILDDGTVKCWGSNGAGELGYGNTDSVGDDETPAGIQPVDLGSGRTATAITVGFSHACAILDDGTVRCWGDGANGALGYADTAAIGDDEAPGSVGPVDLGAGRTATAVSAGRFHTCAILDDGTVRCWGPGWDGRLGYANETSIGDDETPGSVGPVDLGAGRTATTITAGNAHTCAVLDDGTVRCWGFGNAYLGYAIDTSIGDDETPGSVGPVDLGAGRTATAITSHFGHNCAVLDDGAVRCWGFNGMGQLGYGNHDNVGDDETPGSAGPVNLGAGRTATAVAVGDEHSCALLDDATIRCWGRGGEGQLGYGNQESVGDSATPDSAGPVDFSPPKLSATLSADEATVYVGTTIHYHLTIENLSDAPLTGIAVEVGDVDEGEIVPDCEPAATSLEVGGEQTVDCTYAVTEDDEGQYLPTRARVTANEVPTAAQSNSVAFEVERLPFSFAIVAEQTTVTAGDDITFYVYLSNNSEDPLTGITIDAPDTPDCSRDLVDLDPDVFDYFACTYTTTLDDVGVFTNTVTMTADGFPDPIAAQPVDVVVRHPDAVPIGAIAVTGGDSHTCALLEDSTVRCWGINHAGRLGLGVSEDDLWQVDSPENIEPVDLGAGRTATAITAGFDHTCALLDDGTVRCWGVGWDGRLGYGNDQDIGDDETPASVGPIDLGAGRTATAITAGAVNTCAILDDGTVKCWGEAEFGASGSGDIEDIGDDETPADVPPVDLGAGRTAVAIDSGLAYTCAVLDNGTVRCWGRNDFGQLGYASTTDIGDDETPGSVGPIDLGAGRTATAITAEARQTCAVLDDGNVRCWGDGQQGRLGYGNTTSIGDDETPGTAGPVDLGAGRTATALDGWNNTCALLDDGAVRCWGRGDVTGIPGGEPIGDDETPGSLDPIDFGAGRTAIALGAGETHACAVLDNHRIRCWGTGDDGELGDGEGQDSEEPAGLVELGWTVPGGGTSPSLTVAQTADETTVDVGGTVHLHLEVANTGDVALNDVTIDDPAAPDCEAEPFDLAVGADQTLDCAYTPTVADLGTYTNTASVTADEVTTPVESNEVEVTVTIPAGSGLISGTVTESGTGAPIAGAIVAVLSLADYSPVAVANADSSGNYVALAPAGTYLAYSFDPALAHTAGFVGAPTLVTITDGDTIDADIELAPTRGTLTGTVSDTGGPLEGVLAISVDLGTGLPGAGDLTDTNGTYAITGLRNGSHLLEFVDLSGTHTPEFYDDVPTPAGTTIVNVAGAGTTDADADLAVQAASGGGAHLTGNVTSTAAADLEGIAVFAIHASDFSFGAGALTDAAGHYDLDVEPGTYKLAFYDPSGGHAFEWHDNQGPGGLGAAATVTATSGTPLGTDAALTSTTGTITGTVTADGGGALAEVFVAAIDTGGNIVSGTTTGADGTYTLTGIPTGNVRVRYLDLTRAHASEYFDNSPEYDNAALTTTTAGTITNDIDATLALTG